MFVQLIRSACAIKPRYNFLLLVTIITATSIGLIPLQIMKLL